MSIGKIIQDIENVADEKFIEDFFKRHESGVLTYFNAFFLNGRSIRQPFLRQWEVKSIEDVNEQVNHVVEIQFTCAVEAEQTARLPLLALALAYQEMVRGLFAQDEDLIRDAANIIGCLQVVFEKSSDRMRCGEWDCPPESWHRLQRFVDGKGIGLPEELLALLRSKEGSE